MKHGTGILTATTVTIKHTGFVFASTSNNACACKLFLRLIHINPLGTGNLAVFQGRSCGRAYDYLCSSLIPCIKGQQFSFQVGVDDVTQGQATALSYSLFNIYN